MATKAEQFRAEQQRNAKPAKPKRARKPRKPDAIDTSRVGVSASDRKVGAGHTAERNASKRAARKGGARMEDSQTGKPSRKSTRKSTGRVKAATSLARRETRKVSSPAARASRSTRRK